MSSTNDPTAPITIDDRDPRVNYFGSWVLVGTNNGAVHNGTLSITAANNSGFGFVFTGIQVSVYGTGGYSTGPPTIRFTIDNQPPVSFTAPNITTEGDGLLWFQSPPLDPGTHQIVANTTYASDGSSWAVDYLIVEPVGATLPTSASPTPTPTTSPSGSLTTSTGTPTSSPTGGQDNIQHKSSNTGPIVGGVVGGIAIMALILLGVVFWRRRSRASSYKYYGDKPTPAIMDDVPDSGAGSGTVVYPLTGQVTPFSLGGEYNGSSSHIGPYDGSVTGSTHIASKYAVSPSTTSYFPNADTYSSQPLLDTNNVSESGYTTPLGAAGAIAGASAGAAFSVSAGATSIVSAGETSSVSAGAASSVSGRTSSSGRSPYSNFPEKRPIPPDSALLSTSPQSPPTTAPVLVTDSGMRFPPHIAPEQLASPTATAPPAYTRD